MCRTSTGTRGHPPRGHVPSRRYRTEPRLSIPHGELHGLYRGTVMRHTRDDSYMHGKRKHASNYTNTSDRGSLLATHGVHLLGERPVSCLEVSFRLHYDSLHRLRRLVNDDEVAVVDRSRGRDGRRRPIFRSGRVSEQRIHTSSLDVSSRVVTRFLATSVRDP